MKRILIFILLICIKQVDAQVCFNPSANTFSDSLPCSVTGADFNGDGQVDLAIANRGLNTVSILLGNGTGSFGAATNFSVHLNPTSVISADFNGDTKADLAVANGNYSNDVSILLGTGTGSFGASSNFYTGNNTNPWSVISADFNGDGKLDLVTSNSGDNSVSVLLGTGTGSFGAFVSFPLTIGTQPMSLISSDFNGDNKADLAVANRSANNVSVLLGTGTGSFGAATYFGVGTQPYSIITADFNGDSKVDLAIANLVSNNVSVLLGNGLGSFSYAPTFTVSGSTSITSADFNGDAKADLITANNGSSNVSVMLGTGTGTFAFSDTFAIGANIYNYSVISADFNGDAKADFAVANNGSNNLSILLNCTPTPTCVASVTDSLFNISPLNWGIVPHYSPQVTSAVWSWGDGTYTNALYPSHTYTTAGQYNICVTVYTSCGDSATACRNDSIYRTASSNAMVNVNVVPNANSVNQITNSKNQIKVYPNPFTESITINFISEEINKVTYEIFDIMGNQIVKENVHVNKGENEFKINTNSVSKGVYFLNISGNNGRKASTLKIVK